MNNAYPPGVSGNEPEIVGYPDDAEPMSEIEKTLRSSPTFVQVLRALHEAAIAATDALWEIDKAAYDTVPRLYSSRCNCRDYSLEALRQLDIEDDFDPTS